MGQALVQPPEGFAGVRPFVLHGSGDEMGKVGGEEPLYSETSRMNTALHLLPGILVVAGLLLFVIAATTRVGRYFAFWITGGLAILLGLILLLILFGYYKFEITDYALRAGFRGLVVALPGYYKTYPRPSIVSCVPYDLSRMQARDHALVMPDGETGEIEFKYGAGAGVKITLQQAGIEKYVLWAVERPEEVCRLLRADSWARPRG
jgi:hypothetical protein